MNRSSVNFAHLERLTDDTGILEHAIGPVPRRKEGYSTDDQARALWACLAWIGRANAQDARTLNRLIDTYLAFLLWAQQEDGRFHNNYAYDRTKEEEIPSDDCLGRCLWASAYAMAKLEDKGRAMAAASLFEKALGNAESMRFPRGWAYALAAFGLVEKHALYPYPLISGIRTLSDRLLALYREHSKPDWRWFEPSLSYSNALLPWGMFWAYDVLRQQELLSVAQESLNFLIRLSTNRKGQIRPVGNQGWCTPRYRALWDQQPIDVMKLALAAFKAYELTGSAAYAETVNGCLAWFHGSNDAGVPMIREEDGGCYDGLSEEGPNLNQGAEAAISYLLTEAIWQRLVDRQGKELAYAAGKF